MMPVRDQTARPIRPRRRFRQRQTWYSAPSPLQALVDIMLDSLSGSYPQPPLIPMDDEAAAPGPSLFDDNEFDDENLDADLEQELSAAPSTPDTSNSDDSEDSSMTCISDTDRESFRSETSTSTYSTDGSDEDSSSSSSTRKLQELTHSLGTATYSALDMDEDTEMSFISGSGRLSSLMSTRAGFYLERTGDDNGNSLATGEQNSQYGSPAGYYMEGNGEAASGYFDQSTDQDTDQVHRYIGRPAGYYLEDRYETARPAYGLNVGQEQEHVPTPAGYYMEGGSQSPGYLGDDDGEPALAPALLGYYVERTDDIVSAYHARNSGQQSADNNAFVMSLHNLP